MSKYILLISVIAFYLPVTGQETIYPAPANKGIIAISGGTIHVGNGSVIKDGTIIITNNKISSVGSNLQVPAGAKRIDAKGKQVYPGIIATNTNLGLSEIQRIRSMEDFTEIGEYNPSVKSINAYNAESKIIPTIRSNGILLAHIVPQGGTISGTSSVVQLDAWNWQDAVYKLNNGIHLNMPALINRPNPFAAFFQMAAPAIDPVKAGLKRIDDIKTMLREAQSYAKQTNPVINLKYEALKGLFNGTQKLFIHADLVKEMMMAIDMKNEFGLDIVIVGGEDSWMMADLLNDNKIPVILTEPHGLPATADDAIDQPYKTGAQLAKAGVLFTIEIEANHWQQRCLPFQAGTMAAYGLPKEDAIKAITLDAAKILGIDSMTGSIEAGKDANIVISEGDLLDMKSSKVNQAFIQGRSINLDNKQSQLFERYKYKFGIK